MKKRVLIVLTLLFITLFTITAEDKISMDFRNQKITDILYTLSEMTEQSIHIDETVVGNATFMFNDSTFESALERFCLQNHLYYEKSGQAYNISKVKMSVSSQKRVSLNAEDVNVDALLKILSRRTGVTIVTDTLPKMDVSIHIQSSSIIDVIKLIIVKLPGFDVETLQNGYYVYKAQGQGSVRRTSDVLKIEKNDELYSAVITKAQFSSVVDTLFKKGEKEYVLLSKTNTQLENITYLSKSFDELLYLLLTNASFDYSIKNGIYNIYEIDKKTVLRSFKKTEVVKLENIGVEKISSLIPSDLSTVGLKTDKDTNSVYITGTDSEIQNTLEFLKKIDSLSTGAEYKRYTLKNISVSSLLGIVPKSILISDIVPLSDGVSFITQVEESNREKLEEFIALSDTKEDIFTIKLKYIKAKELINHLPPNIDKSQITETQSDTILFFTGNKYQFKEFQDLLKEIDKPLQQIKYQVLLLNV